MKLSKNINRGLKLYRYDVVEPPKDWSVKFKSPLYIYEERCKNEFGAYFFFDNEKETIEVGKNALCKHKDQIKQNNPELKLWITEACILKECKILDLSELKDVVDLYVSLWNENINIYRDDFYIVRNHLRTIRLSEIKDIIIYLATHQDDSELVEYQELNYEIMKIFSGYEAKDHLRYACQGLTDFSNGSIFKMILENEGLDGYIFKESEANTFCLFNSICLAPPKTHELKFSSI